MSIITISRGSYSRGKEVAEAVAQRLGYACVSRDQVIEEASDEFNIPEIKLVRAIHDAPSILDRFTYGKERFVTYFEAAFLARMQRDDVIYHGLAGHFFLTGVSHVLKVRIITDMEERVKLEMERNGGTYQEAFQVLKRDDEERKRWSRHLYDIDTMDPFLYDLVIHIKKIGVEDAVGIICQTVRSERFQTTPESQQTMNDLVLAASVKAALVALRPDIEVISREGHIVLRTKALVSEREKIFQNLKKASEGVPGVKGVDIDIKSMTP